MGHDHFYSLDEVDQAHLSIGYRQEGVACVVLAHEQPGFDTIPVYSYFSQKDDNHYLTTDAPGQYWAKSAQDRGYEAQNNGQPVFYVFSRPQGGKYIPFYQWYHAGNHFYTTHSTGEQASWDGADFQGVLGYVWEAKAEVVGCFRPLYRYYKA